jgi:hypothetical protein
MGTKLIGGTRKVDDVSNFHTLQIYGRKII